jgi:hypothetical protein
MADVARRGWCSERGREEWRVEAWAVSSGRGVHPFYWIGEGAGALGGGRWW